MNLTFRRLIYLSFILTFIVAGTLLLLYLQGFRYDFKNGEVERTGAIAVDTLPAGATMVISGAVWSDPTPTTAQALRPGDYDVVLTLTGYQSWQKRLHVTQSQVTNTGTVRLWPVPSSGQRLSDTPPTAALLSPNQENLLYQLPAGLSAGLWLLNLATGKTALITRLASNSITDLSWAPSSREFLAQEHAATGTRYQTYSLERSTWEDITLPQGLTPLAIHWGEDEHELLIITPQALYSLDRDSGTTRLLWRETLMDVRVHDGLVWGLVRSVSGSQQLKALNRHSLQVLEFTEPLPLSSGLKFLEASGNWLPVFDTDRHTLYLVRSPLREPKYLRRLPEVTGLDWSADGERLIITNNFEIWDYQINEDRLNLALRVSSPITQARQVPGEQYLVYGTGHEVWALELDNRGNQQQWKLASYTTDIENLFFDQTAHTLTVETNDGLYRLTLMPQATGLLDVLPINSPVTAIQKFLHQSTGQ